MLLDKGQTLAISQSATFPLVLFVSLSLAVIESQAGSDQGDQFSFLGSRLALEPFAVGNLTIISIQ